MINLFYYAGESQLMAVVRLDDIAIEEFLFFGVLSTATSGGCLCDFTFNQPISPKIYGSV